LVCGTPEIIGLIGTPEILVPLCIVLDVDLVSLDTGGPQY